jgi:4-amino-4-deoxy-L-arabinose transferase-like glycosyltransferase
MPKPDPSHRLRAKWLLFAILLLSAVLHLWGLGRDLPHTPEVDEPTFASAAVHIVATGNLNPHWFGHPGATLIYPLAALYHIEHALTSGSPLFQPMPTLQTRFDAHDPTLYFFGRLLTVAYALATIPLLHHLALATFRRQSIALLAPFLFTLYPFATLHARWIRTDSPSIFFTVLSLWLCLRLLTRPKPINQIAAGAAIGLAIATKYYLVVLALVFIAANLPHSRASLQLAIRSPKPILIPLFTGAAAALTTFALASPYFFLDWPAVRANLLFESRSVHPGADGLSPLGNLLWYLTVALPAIMTWPQLLLLAAALVITIHRPPAKAGIRPFLLLLFAFPFLIGISLSPLHQQRWLLPLLPIFTLFTAHALLQICIHLRVCNRQSASHSPRLLQTKLLPAVLLLLVIALPAYNLLLLNIQLSRPSTRILAGNWIQANLPAGSDIAFEEYTAPPLLDAGYRTHRTFALGWGDVTLDTYRADGFRYLVVSDEMYNRFLTQPERFPAAAAFYRTLFTHARLLAEFQPSPTRAGPLIRIYDLSES